MEIRHIPIAGSSLLETADEFLATLSAADFPPPRAVGGKWQDDIADGPPRTNRPSPTWRRCARLAAPPALVAAMPRGAEVSAINYYPASGGLGWHTDATRPGWRLYVALGPVAPGIFIYRKTTGGKGLCADMPGLATAFYISPDWRQNWHAVWVPAARFSIGIKIDDTIAASLGLV